jgi:hypothetical protein
MLILAVLTLPILVIWGCSEYILVHVLQQNLEESALAARYVHLTIPGNLYLSLIFVVHHLLSCNRFNTVIHIRMSEKVCAGPRAHSPGPLCATYIWTTQRSVELSISIGAIQNWL